MPRFKASVSPKMNQEVFAFYQSNHHAFLPPTVFHHEFSTMPNWHLHSQKPESTNCQITRQTDAVNYVAVFPRLFQIQNSIRFIQIGSVSAGVSPAGPFSLSAPIRHFSSTSQITDDILQSTDILNRNSCTSSNFQEGEC